MAPSSKSIFVIVVEVEVEDIINEAERVNVSWARVVVVVVDDDDNVVVNYVV